MDSHKQKAIPRNFAGARYVSTDFSNHDFSKVDMQNAYFQRCDFTGASFKDAKLSRSKFHNCWLDGADFSGAVVQNAMFNRCILADANLTGANFFKTIMPNSVVRNINFTDVKEINERTRELIGELLRQHAGNSHKKLQLALSVANDPQICWEQWQKIAFDSKLFHYWVIEVFKQYPESRLLETFLGKKNLLIPSQIASYNRNVKLETFPAYHIAICKLGEETYVANTNGQNKIVPEMVLGKLLSEYPDRKFKADKEDEVEVAYETVMQPPSLADVTEVYWPYAPVQLLTAADWTSYAREHVEEMKSREQSIVDRILDVIDFSKGKMSVLDPACSHGLLLHKLHETNENLELYGQDLSSEMVKVARAEAPAAQISKGSVLEPFSPLVDVCINRAACHFVLTKADAEKAVAAGMESLKKGGRQLLHSAGPPLLSPDEMAQFGRLSQKVYFDGTAVSALYIIEK